MTIDQAQTADYRKTTGLTPELECIEMCTDGWNTCLASLSQLAESGQGSPFGS
jgi:hypothetical protein